MSKRLRSVGIVAVVALVALVVLRNQRSVGPGLSARGEMISRVVVPQRDTRDGVVHVSVLDGCGCYRGSIAIYVMCSIAGIISF